MRGFKNSLGICLHMFAYIIILLSLFLPFHKDYLTSFNFRKVVFDKQNVKRKWKHVMNNRCHSMKSTSSIIFDMWLLSEHVASKNNYKAKPTWNNCPLHTLAFLLLSSPGSLFMCTTVSTECPGSRNQGQLLLLDSPTVETQAMHPVICTAGVENSTAPSAGARCTITISSATAF